MTHTRYLILDQASYRSMPWANGQGTTTEHFISPEGSQLKDGNFSYRISCAQIHTKGPFSIINGYDRLFVPLKGSALELNIAGSTHHLSPGDMMLFKGEDATYCTPTDPIPALDYNVMANRAKFSMLATVMRAKSPSLPLAYEAVHNATVIIYNHQIRTFLNTQAGEKIEIMPGQTCIIESGASSFTQTYISGDGFSIIAVLIHRSP